MPKSLVINAILVLVTLTATASAQNTNSSQTVRPRTTTTPSNSNRSSADSQSDGQKPATTTSPTARTAATKPKAGATEAPGSQAVAAAFNALLNGIRHADVTAVSNVYWNSPRLLLFNSNGSVTRTWAQMRRNRESSYREAKDVKLEVRDLSISMLGRDGAVVTCLWTQTQTFKGSPETASGRMTLVFKRIANEWKAIHLHTSPDRPDPARVLPSEQSPTSSPSPSS